MKTLKIDILHPCPNHLEYLNPDAIAEDLRAAHPGTIVRYIGPPTTRRWVGWSTEGATLQWVAEMWPGDRAHTVDVHVRPMRECGSDLWESAYLAFAPELGHAAYLDMRKADSEAVSATNEM